MNTTKKVGIAFAAIILGIVISPAIPISEAGAAKRVEISLESISDVNTVETVKIVGLENVSFAPRRMFLLHQIQLTSKKGIALSSSM
jgi:hypothetical protein